MTKGKLELLGERIQVIVPHVSTHKAIRGQQIREYLVDSPLYRYNDCVYSANLGKISWITIINDKAIILVRSADGLKCEALGMINDMGRYYFGSVSVRDISKNGVLKLNDSTLRKRDVGNYELIITFKDVIARVSNDLSTVFTKYTCVRLDLHDYKHVDYTESSVESVKVNQNTIEIKSFLSNVIIDSYGEVYNRVGSNKIFNESKTAVYFPDDDKIVIT